MPLTFHVVLSLPLQFTPEFDDFHKHHPSPVVANWEEIKQFGKDVHANVVKKLLVLFAIVLELEDEQYFVKRHVYEEKSEDRESLLDNMSSFDDLSSFPFADSFSSPSLSQTSDT